LGDCTYTAGRVQFRQAVDLSTTAGRLRVEPGETLYLLTYRCEGVTTAWFGRLYDEVGLPILQRPLREQTHLQRNDPREAADDLVDSASEYEPVDRLD
jgi:hypothetical protein